MKKVDAAAGTITFDDEDGEEMTLPVTGGRVKLQWKPDFRRALGALGVDFEMFGKDHGPNMGVYDRICVALAGGRPSTSSTSCSSTKRAEDLQVEGQRHHDRRVADLCADGSLGLYMFQKPRAAKKLYFDVIPRAVDEYYQFLAAYPGRTGRSGWATRSGTCTTATRQPSTMPVPFSMLLNLATASNPENAGVMWGFISRAVPGVTPSTHPSSTAGGLRHPVFPRLREEDLSRAGRGGAAGAGRPFEALGALPAGADGEAIQNAALDVARVIPRYQDLEKKSPTGGPGVSGAFFQMIYQVLIGQEARAALRLLRLALRHRADADPDR